LSTLTGDHRLNLGKGKETQQPKVKHPARKRGSAILFDEEEKRGGGKKGGGGPLFDSQKRPKRRRKNLSQSGSIERCSNCRKKSMPHASNKRGRTGSDGPPAGGGEEEKRSIPLPAAQIPKERVMPFFIRSGGVYARTPG